MPDRGSRASDGKPDVRSAPEPVAEHRLLIVDDDPAFRAVARELLAGVRFRVVGEAVDGARCLEQIRVLRPDVVLLDVQLPDVSGFHVCRAILDAHTGSHTGSEVSVVLCSVRDAADYGQAVVRCGARAFVPKAGLSIEALLRALGDEGPGG